MQDDAAEASWYPVTSLPVQQLAFDHKQIIREALEKLSGRSEVQKTSKGTTVISDHLLKQCCTNYTTQLGMLVIPDGCD